MASPAMHDLKTTEGVHAYLKGTRFTASDVQLLSGGQSAFTYRVILEAPAETGEKTIVIKHFEEFIAGMKNVQAPAERAEYEYRALSAIASSGLFDSNSIVQVPRPIEYDKETHTIFMQDLGSPIPLAQVLEKGFPDSSGSDTTETSSSEEIYQLTSEIGGALGDFMGRFHNWSALPGPKQAELRAYFAQKPHLDQIIVTTRNYYSSMSADRFGIREDWMAGSLTGEHAQPEASADSTVLVMGECSLHNMLVSPPSKERNMRVYLIDLEMARISYPEIDIGGLTASGVSFERLYYPGLERPFVSSFHQAYRSHRTLDAKRIATTTGTELMGFGTILPWARALDEAKLKEVAVAGLELWKASVRGHEDEIKGNPVVQHLFPL